MLTTKKAAELLEPYYLGKLLSIEKIPAGQASDSYIVTTNYGKYVLRCNKRPRTKESFLFDIAMLQNLPRFPVPQYLKDVEGNEVRYVQGQYYVVYSLLPGRNPAALTSSLLKQIAHLLAEIHRRGRHFKTKAKKQGIYDLPDNRIAHMRKVLLRELPQYKGDIYYLEKGLLQNKLPESLPRGPLHADVKRENILAQDGRLTGLVDFDNCMIGPYLLDLSIAITWLCTHPVKGLNYRNAKRFVQWYEERRVLCKEERLNLFRALRFAYLSHEWGDYDHFVRGEITEDYFHFGRKFFLSAAKKLDHQRFIKLFNSRTLF